MAKDPDDLIAQPAKSRYEAFVMAAKETGQLWTLAAEDALLILGIEGHEEFVVVFPSADVVGDWFEASGLEEADLVSMSTDDWRESTLDELKKDGVEVCVFPNADDEGTFIGADKLKEALNR